MKLANYLTEAKGKYSIDDLSPHQLADYTKYDSIPDVKKVIELFNQVQKDCQPFLKESGGNLLFRGMNNQPKYGKKKARNDRRPADTPDYVSEEVDKQTKKSFGWKTRSEGTFSTGREAWASSYGAGYIIYPIGQFRYVYSPTIKDSYDVLGQRFKGNFQELKMTELYELWESEFGEGAKRGYWRLPTRAGGENIESYNAKSRAELVDLIYPKVKKLEYWSDSSETEIKAFIFRKALWMPDLPREVWVHTVVANIEDSRKDFPEVQRMFEETVAYLLKHILSYTNRDLVTGIHKGHEVILNCKQYYFFDKKYQYLIKDLQSK